MNTGCLSADGVCVSYGGLGYAVGHILMTRHSTDDPTVSALPFSSLIICAQPMMTQSRFHSY